MLRTELLYRWLTETIDLLNELNNPEIVKPPADIVSCSIKVPYLLDELLAHAATHLSVIRPEQQDYYRTHAAHLQNH
ncbi:uncharacterized protein AKAW2_61036A [Aspergillus luchuensis]|nr:uncharacterized protein AKAW2_61036A [Aspergillus luchuensis]BCS02772.1 hypothetical protein AKAW2_61036A [Aspergillus luchuensis]BCS14426.1 hypothetical protein ALUC_60982A [Aspergillus luchuensis]GAT30055.1 C6 finger domain protein [Aspergillus luchuensis]